MRPSIWRRRLVLRVALIVASSCAGTLGIADAAQAAFPGTNAGKIAFESDRAGNSDIFTMNFDGSNVVNLTPNPAFDEEPNVSPDGTKVLFDSTRSGNGDIYVASAAGGGETTPLTSSMGADVRAAWSGDGTKVAFVSNRTGNDEIFVMNADGSGQIDISNNAARDDAPNWSADGSSVKQLTTSTATDADPKFSPNGALITFSSNRDGNYNIYVMGSSGAGQRRLTTNAAEDGEPAFSPQGNAIVFLSNRNGNREIYRMRSSDGASQINLTANRARDIDPDWGPPPTPAPPTGTFSCRASAVHEFHAAQEPVIANAAQQPCADDVHDLAFFEVDSLNDAIPTDPFTVNMLHAATDLTAGSSANATASGTLATIPPTEVSPKITVESYSTQARAACVGGTPALTGSSQVTGLRIGSGDAITTSAPMDILVPLLGILHLNQQIVVGTTITQRAIFLEGGADGLYGDILLGEATADFEGNPCA